MEKYTRFADPTTGTNPFLPTWTTRAKESWALWIPRVTFGILLLPFRIVLLALGALSFLLVHGFAWPLGFCPVIQRYVRLALEAFPLKVILVSLGVLNVIEKNADARRLKLAAGLGRFKTSSNEAYISSDSVVFSNYTNVVEVLYLTLRYQPVFSIIYPNGTLDIVSSLQMLTKSLSHNGASPEATAKGSGRFSSLLDLDKHMTATKRGPVIVFPEVFKSNGTVILEWATDALCPRKKSRQEIHDEVYDLCRMRSRVVGFQYDVTAAYSPPHTAFSPWYHIFCLLLSNVWRPVTFVYTSQQQIREVLEHNVKSTGRPLTSEEVIQVLRQTMWRMLPGVQLVGITGERLPEFASFFSASQATKYRSV